MFNHDRRFNLWLAKSNMKGLYCLRTHVRICDTDYDTCLWSSQFHCLGAAIVCHCACFVHNSEQFCPKLKCLLRDSSNVCSPVIEVIGRSLISLNQSDLSLYVEERREQENLGGVRLFAAC